MWAQLGGQKWVQSLSLLWNSHSGRDMFQTLRVGMFRLSMMGCVMLLRGPPICTVASVASAAVPASGSVPGCGSMVP